MIVLSLLTILMGSAAWAGEQVVLTSGFRLQADRHEREGAIVRIYTKAGITEIPADSVASVEVEEYVPPAPASAAVEPPAQTRPNPVESKPMTPRELVDQAADQSGIPREFLHLVAKAESNYQVNAVSPKGAIGIMQLMPETAASLNADPHDPKQNVEAGTRYLRDLLLKYQDHPDQVRRALAAYNAGPGAVDRYNGVPPYRETQLYVHKIVDAYRKVVPAAGR